MAAIHVMIKPASSSCNMRCGYCFYHEVAQSREVYSYGIMEDYVLEQVVKKSLAASDTECAFTFQGGEPTLAGLAFYRKFADFAEKYNVNDVKVTMAIQTNGILLDREWTAFLKEHDFLVGISLDGLQEFHDHYRKDAAGQNTYNRVKKAIALLQREQVDFNVLTVVSPVNYRSAVSIYRNYKKNGWTYMQFIPCLPPLGENKAPYALTALQYGRFLRDLFDVWYEDMAAGNYVYIRFFNDILLILTGQQPVSCSSYGVCSSQYVVEADGSVYPCDFYVTDEYRIGSFCQNDIEEMNENRRKTAFIETSFAVPEECRFCRWYAVCRNGCGRERETLRADGHTDRAGKNRFCEAYKTFYEYSRARWAELARKWY